MNGSFSFSIKDEIIAENTSTYTIDGDKVNKQSNNSENFIPFEIFSSLLFGGISLEEALLAGFINFEPSGEAFKFFSFNRNIYLSEQF